MKTNLSLVLSAQYGKPMPKRDPTSVTEMRVWALPKAKVGASGELNAFVPDNRRRTVNL